MSTSTVKFSFKPSRSTLVYGAMINGVPLPLDTNGASLRMTNGEEFMLTWWIVGKAGDKLAIKVNHGKPQDLFAAEDAISPGEKQAAGYARMTP